MSAWSGGNETWFNMSLDEYLESQLGPKHLALSTVVPLTVVLLVIFIAGVVGNVCVCLVIIKNQSMHTATNYYLFSLAVSDLTLLILGKFLANQFIFPGKNQSVDLLTQKSK